MRKAIEKLRLEMTFHSIPTLHFTKRGPKMQISCFILPFAWVCVLAVDQIINGFSWVQLRWACHLGLLNWSLKLNPVRKWHRSKLFPTGLRLTVSLMSTTWKQTNKNKIEVTHIKERMEVRKNRTPCLSHAKRALSAMSYIPFLKID